MALGIIPYQDGAPVEALLAGVVASLRGDGVSVAGLLQYSSRAPNGRPRMDLADIASGAVIRISQNLGADSAACCVDPAGIAEAAGYLRQAIDSKPDLLVISKFSRLEAAGGGLRAEFLEALAREIPVLTGLPERHRAQFKAMTGGMGLFLTAEPDSVMAWWRDVTSGLPAADRQGGSH